MKHFDAAELEALFERIDLVGCMIAAFGTPEGAPLRQRVDLVGGYRPDMREIDDRGILRGRLFVDVYEAVLAKAGDLIQPIATGILQSQSIAGDLSSLTLNRAQRQNDEEITLFKSVGTATADLAAAAVAWRLHETISEASEAATPRIPSIGE